MNSLRRRGQRGGAEADTIMFRPAPAPAPESHSVVTNWKVYQTDEGKSETVQQNAKAKATEKRTEREREYRTWARKTRVQRKRIKWGTQWKVWGKQTKATLAKRTCERRSEEETSSKQC